MQRRSAFTVLAASAALLVTLGEAWAQDGYDHMMGWGGGWFGMILGPMFMIVGLAVAIALALVMARWLGGLPGASSPPPRTALDILKERFARGEIDKAEYEDRRRALSD